MRSLNTLLLVFSAISFIIVIGGGAYEHINMVPTWKLSPPASLAMFQGKYGINPGTFWMVIHPVTLVLIIAALVTNWKTGRRKSIGIVLLGYALLLVATGVYFVPELLSIIHTPYALLTDNSLVRRAANWEKWSLVRLALCLVLAIVLLLSLTKTEDLQAKRSS